MKDALLVLGPNICLLTVSGVNQEVGCPVTMLPHVSVFYYPAILPTPVIKVSSESKDFWLAQGELVKVNLL